MATAKLMQHKARLSITLTQDSAEFLRAFSAEENAHVSTVIENLVERFKLAKERAQLNASIAARYDSLPESAMQEEAMWGTVGAAGLTEMIESEIEPATAETSSAGR